MTVNAILIDNRDNVVVLTSDIEAGETIDTGSMKLTATYRINMGHKAAIIPMSAGADIMKYGVVIGRASSHISKGEWVHTHNTEDITAELCAGYQQSGRDNDGV